MKNPSDQGPGSKKGFVLVLSLFVMIALSILISGGFLALSQQQRAIQREIDRLKINWAAEAIFDRAVFLLDDYMLVNNTFPPEDGTTPDPNIEDASGELFSTKLTAWFAAQFGSLYPNNPVKAISISLKRVDQEAVALPATPAWKKYVVEAVMDRAATQMKMRLKQQLWLRSGGIYDYGVFWGSGDLEISSATDTVFQGPLFANGNIYITPSSGNPHSNPVDLPHSITFTRTGNRFVLGATKEIFYNFKRTSAKNYFLEKSGAMFRNPIFAAGAPAYLRTDNALISKNGRPHTSSCSGWRVCDPMYKYNRYIPDGNRMPGGVAGFSEQARAWPASDAGMTAMELADFDVHWLERPHQVTDEYVVRPFFYYFKNQLQHLGYPEPAPSYSVRAKTYICKDEMCSDKAELVPLQDFSTIGLFRHYASSSWVESGAYDDWYGWKSFFWGISPGYDATQYPRFDEAWTPENPVMDIGPVQNPYFHSTLSALDLQDLVLTDQAPKKLALGAGNNDPHILTEPVQTGDIASVKAAKLQSKAEVHILCGDPACTVLQVKRYNAGTAAWDITVSSPAWLTSGSMYDYRLREQVRTVDIDVGTLSAALTTSYYPVTDPLQSGYAVYVQTCSRMSGAAACGSTSYRAVRLMNGGTLPSQNITFITNGRLWVKGDYNTQKYDYSKAIPTACSSGPDCRVPSAAFFSDSFGVLSNEWSDGYTASLPFNQRRVTNDVTVNGAIISGYLPSQLEMGFPNCRGHDENGNTTAANIYTGCYTNPPWVTEDGEPSAHMLKRANNNTWIPFVSTLSCTDGFEPATGNPVNPLTCDIRLDLETGIYYFRRVHLLSVLFVYQYWKANDTSQRTTLPDSFCQNPGDDFNGDGVGEPNNSPANNFFVNCKGDLRRPFDNAALINAALSVINKRMPRVCNNTPSAPSVQFPPPAGNPPAGANNCINWATLRNYNAASAQTADDILISCANNDACWNALNDALGLGVPGTQGVNVSATATPKFARIGLLDRENNSFTPASCRPYYDKDNRFLDLCYPADLQPSTCFPNCPAGTSPVRILPRWEIPYFVSPYAFRSRAIIPEHSVASPEISRSVDPTLEFRDYDYAGIPIFQDRPPEGVPPLPGIYYELINYGYLYSDQIARIPCGQFQVVLDPPGCNPGEGQACDYKYTCSGAQDSERFLLHGLGYDGSEGPSLYIPRYSGGLENLVNYQEDWRNSSGQVRTVNLSGVLTSPWNSKELVLPSSLGGGPAFWNYDPTHAYYTAPVRNASYATMLRSVPPPASPGIYSVKRGQRSETSEV